MDLLTTNKEIDISRTPSLKEQMEEIDSLSHSGIKSSSSKCLESMEEFLLAERFSKQELERISKLGLVSLAEGHIVYKFSLSNKEILKYQDGQHHFLVVDLASTEKLRKSVYLGDKMMETVEKNSSLVCFSKSINYLISHQKESINYSECRLVEMLKHALGGDSLTCYVITISLNDVDKDRTINSLIFAERLTTLENSITIPPKRLKREANTRKSQLSAYQQSHGFQTSSKLSPLRNVQNYEETNPRQLSGVANVKKYESSTPLSSSWIDKCQSLLGYEKSEINSLKEKNSTLELEVEKLRKLVELSRANQSSIDDLSPAKEMSFFSSENDRSLQSILRHAEQKLLYDTEPSVASKIDNNPNKKQTLACITSKNHNKMQINTKENNGIKSMKKSCLVNTPTESKEINQKVYTQHAEEIERRSEAHRIEKQSLITTIASLKAEVETKSNLLL